MGLLDDPVPLFTPKARYRPQDNQAALSALGETCYQCGGEGCEKCQK